MKVLLIVDNYFPSPKSAAKHFYDLARALTELGHEPTVLTCSDRITEPCELSVEDEIPIIRIRTAEMKSSNRVLRALREVRLPLIAWMRAKKTFRKMQCDLVVFYSPTIFWGPLVYRLKKLFGVPAYLYLRDIFPQWALDAGIIRKSPAYYFFRAVERFQYAICDVIAVQAKGDLLYFAGTPALKNKLEVIYNWGPTDEGSLPVRNFRARLGLEGKTVFFFGGTFGQAQNMDAILDLARGLADDDTIRILLAGGGTESERIKSTLIREHLQNVLMIPHLNQWDYLSLVSEIDVGIVSLARSLKTQNIPGKSLSYAYSAKPVLASLNPGAEFGEMVREYQAGLVSEAGDRSTLVSNAKRLAGDPALRRAMGQNNRKLYDAKFELGTAIASLLKAAGKVA